MARAPTELSIFLHSQTSSTYVLEILAGRFFLITRPGREGGTAGYLKKEIDTGGDR